MIIHRDLKVDNVGVATDGILKLFDFGLSRCVLKRQKETEAYKMTGGTGTLRYMAPEVALSLHYNEKADVYSYAIVIWALLSKQIPFKDLDRKGFRDRVVLGGERPPLDDSWPAWLKALLCQAWNPDPILRPSMTEVVRMFDLNFDASPSASEESSQLIVGKAGGRTS
eukprot:gene8920-11443_t